MLEGYDWLNEAATDIGLTLEKGAPRLGVLTIRRLNLATHLNYHVRRKLKGYHWSTIAVDTRTHIEGDQKWQQRKFALLLTLGCHTGGAVYSPDGTLQIDSTSTDVAYANDRPYSATPAWGRRYVLELHNDNYSARALPEDTRLQRAAGFDPDGLSLPKWSYLTLRPGSAPLSWCQPSIGCCF